MFSAGGSSSVPSLFGGGKPEPGKKDESKKDNPAAGLFGSGPNREGALLSGSMSSPADSKDPKPSSTDPPKTSGMFASLGGKATTPNPAPSFISKGEANMTGSLFGGSSMFGAPKKEEEKKEDNAIAPTVPKTSQPTSGLFGGFAPTKTEEKKEEPKEASGDGPFMKRSAPAPLFGATPVSVADAGKTGSFPKAEEKKPESGGLFSGAIDRGMFAPQKPNDAAKKVEDSKPEEKKPVEKSESAPSLFPSVHSFGDPKKSTEPTPTPPPAPAPAPTPPPTTTKPPQDATPLFGGTPLNLGSLPPKDTTTDKK